MSSGLMTARRIGIEVQNLSKNYSDAQRSVPVLNDLSFEIQLGSGTCILGPSGCGKTTLLNILAGLDKPSSGSVKIFGKDYKDMNEKEKAFFRNQNIGMVFQFYHLLPELTALENVLLPAIIRGKNLSSNDRARRAHVLLERVGLAHRMTHFPSELSGGEQQRAAIARALMNDPAFLFCDEPTGNLDRQSAQGVAELLQELFRKDGKTVLIVTHDERIAKMTNNVWNLMTNEWSEQNGT